MDVMNLVESMLRWFHVVAGILWIGLLYFFNWVNSAFAPTMDGETKKKVVPQLMPRALYWFRWGAALTWITGVLLLAIVFYHGKIVFADTLQSWNAAGYVAAALTFLGVFLYDALQKPLAKNPSANFVVMWLLASAIVVLIFGRWAGFGARAQMIHLGSMFGTTMAFNVWYRIWPAQRKIITAVRDGAAPDAALVALAGTRSKHNTFMSVPLVFTMVNAHNVWAWDQVWAMPAIILVGWFIVQHLYKRAAKVPGF